MVQQRSHAGERHQRLHRGHGGELHLEFTPAARGQRRGRLHPGQRGGLAGVHLGHLAGRRTRDQEQRVEALGQAGRRHPAAPGLQATGGQRQAGLGRQGGQRGAAMQPRTQRRPAFGRQVVVGRAQPQAAFLEAFTQAGHRKGHRLRAHAGDGADALHQPVSGFVTGRQVRSIAVGSVHRAAREHIGPRHEAGLHRPAHHQHLRAAVAVAEDQRGGRQARCDGRGRGRHGQVSVKVWSEAVSESGRCGAAAGASGVQPAASPAVTSATS